MYVHLGSLNQGLIERCIVKKNVMYELHKGKARWNLLSFPDFPNIRLSYAFFKKSCFICKNRTDMASFLGCFFTLYAHHTRNSFISPLTSGAAGRVTTTDASNTNYELRKPFIAFPFIFLTNFKPCQPVEKKFFFQYIYCILPPILRASAPCYPKRALHPHHNSNAPAAKIRLCYVVSHTRCLTVFRSPRMSHRQRSLM